MAPRDIGTRYRDFVLRALEGSVYVAGREHGLTLEELQEIGGSSGTSGVGALRQALDYLENDKKIESVRDRYRVTGGGHGFVTFPLGRYRRDHRNFDALDFCVKYLGHKWEHTGIRSASFDEIAAEAQRAGIDRHDMDVAVVILTMSGFVDGNDEALRLVDGREGWMTPSEIADQIPSSGQRERPEFVQIFPQVQAAIAKRGAVSAGAATIANLVPSMQFVPRGVTSAAARSAPPTALATEHRVPTPTESVPEVFIVHGRDDAAKESVARFVERLDLKATILHEQPNGGRTVIEKLLEHSSRAKYAIVLVTADDVGALRGDESNLQPRARQNVVFEWGLFVGLLGRANVCALLKDGCPLPSDLAGLVYLPFDDGGGWKAGVAKEMRLAGLLVDLNRL